MTIDFGKPVKDFGEHVKVVRKRDGKLCAILGGVESGDIEFVRSFSMDVARAYNFMRSEQKGNVPGPPDVPFNPLDEKFA